MSFAFKYWQMQLLDFGASRIGSSIFPLLLGTALPSVWLLLSVVSVSEFEGLMVVPFVKDKKINSLFVSI